MVCHIAGFSQKHFSDELFLWSEIQEPKLLILNLNPTKEFLRNPSFSFLF